MLLSVEDIFKILKKNGIKKGDNIFLHIDAFVTAFIVGSSLEKKIDNLICGFINYIGPNGTLILPTFSYSSTKNQPFNPLTTKSDVGIVTEYFRKKKNILRSSNPIFSVASVGKLSEDFQKSSTSDCFGKGTCFDLMYKNNFWIITLGCSFDRITFIHYVDQFNNVSYRYFKNFKSIIINNSKNIESSIKYFVRDLNRQSSVKLDKLKQRLDELGFLSRDQIGRANFLAVKSVNFFNVANEMISIKENIHIIEGNDGI
ncbi:aminoglycoside N(3)-acetyltransferase [Flavobacteriaceae bacterium PRS1]|nr:aminoglycoside N(3)-acetyltransferase [Flavobacteriaceae bacterium PRS1]